MTKSISLCLLIIMQIISLLLFSCGNEESKTCPWEAVTHSELVVIDSIGSMTDPLQMLGIVVGSIHHPDGGLLVLDRISNNLRLFQPDGEIVVLAPEGSGPGCIQRASEMVIAGDQILVIDKGKRSILRYSLSGEHLGIDTPTGLFEPYGIFGFANGDILSMVLGFQMSEADEVELFIRIGQYNDSLEYSTEYFYQTWLPPYNGIYSAISMMRYCSSPDGPVYFCPDLSEYKVIILGADAEAIGEIYRPDIERVSRSEEEIEAIRQRQQERQGNEFLFQGRNDPNPYMTLIQLAGTDSLNRLWIWKLNDISDGYIRLDIWTPEGELVEQAEIEWKNREPVAPFVDSGGVLLKTTEEASVVRIYEIVYSPAS
ncbi:MAG: hypothetical protein KAR40_18230 [Candidatus Sabulitectum sp.]|nr:hypothetical protein [Candidatus Sabulitectum sp.]